MDTFESMGCRIVVGGATSAELRAVRALFDARDRMFSRFRSDSELCRVNAVAAAAVLVSAPFAAAVEAALVAADETDGLVDPTLLDALEHAGYDRDFGALAPDARPSGPAVPGRPRALRLAGRILFRPPGVRLDLAGVVKAMAVDDALGLLGGDGFVSAGGDLAARGPLDVGLPGGGAVRLLRGGVATSGSARRRWRRGGVEHHHLIDPRTGRPAESPWQQVTVSGATCLGADVAAKAAFLLGDGGPAWLAGHGLAGRFVSWTEEIVAVAGWPSETGVAACT
ncbi:MAG: ApbE family lipoprotein [Solirubrobacterales bacterium]|nr:ApbE family lipoprotein [Solirubrobacterales bacterium]